MKNTLNSGTFHIVLNSLNYYFELHKYFQFLTAGNVEEVYFRDFANNLTYHGMIESFAETDKHKEIILRTWIVMFSYTDREVMYLAGPDNFWVV